MRKKRPEYELPIPGPAWTRGAGHPAAVYYLAGSCHFVAASSPGEDELVGRGGIRIATVRFDRDTPRHLPPGPVRALPHAEAARRFGHPAGN